MKRGLSILIRLLKCPSPFQILSPAILEDFGLSAALSWLITTLQRYDMKVMIDIIDIDSLLPLHSHIVIYRTVQEILTNIGKTPRPEMCPFQSARIRVIFHSPLRMTESDLMKRLSNARGIEARGLGFGTMKGRCRIVEGVLRIWTKEAEGTRITPSVPIKQGQRNNGILLCYTG